MMGFNKNKSVTGLAVCHKRTYLAYKCVRVCTLRACVYSTCMWMWKSIAESKKCTTERAVLGCCKFHHKQIGLNDNRRQHIFITTREASSGVCDGVRKHHTQSRIARSFIGVEHRVERTQYQHTPDSLSRFYFARRVSRRPSAVGLNNEKTHNDRSNERCVFQVCAARWLDVRVCDTRYTFILTHTRGKSRRVR